MRLSENQKLILVYLSLKEETDRKTLWKKMKASVALSSYKSLAVFYHMIYRNLLQLTRRGLINFDGEKYSITKEGLAVALNVSKNYSHDDNLDVLLEKCISTKLEDLAR